MKTAKRILSIALALALGLLALVPATALSIEENDPNAPVVTTAWLEYRVLHGETFDGIILAQLPEGVDGQLSAAWYFGDVLLGSAPVAGGSARITMTATPDMPPETWLRAVVTNTYTDGDGREQTASAALEKRIFVQSPMAPVFKDILRLGNTRVGGRFDITLDVRLPEGVEGKISVAWYLDGKLVAIGEKLDIRATQDMSPEVYFLVVATNTYVDENGRTQTASAAREVFDFVDSRLDQLQKFLGMALVLLTLPVNPMFLMVVFMVVGGTLGWLWSLITGLFTR